MKDTRSETRILTKLGDRLEEIAHSKVQSGVWDRKGYEEDKKTIQHLLNLV